MARTMAGRLGWRCVKVEVGQGGSSRVAVLNSHMSSIVPTWTMNRELTNAKQRVASAHERLGLQRVHLRTLRAGRYDTDAAETAFRTMRQTMEASEEDRFQIEAELVMARAGGWS